MERAKTTFSSELPITLASLCKQNLKNGQREKYFTLCILVPNTVNTESELLITFNVFDPNMFHSF